MHKNRVSLVLEIFLQVVLLSNPLGVEEVLLESEKLDWIGHFVSESWRKDKYTLLHVQRPCDEKKQAAQAEKGHCD